MEPTAEQLACDHKWRSFESTVTVKSDLPAADIKAGDQFLMTGRQCLTCDWVEVNPIPLRKN